MGRIRAPDKAAQFARPVTADNIILEELAEAFAAAEAGDLAHARQELAQCAAVCIRAMEYIEKGMETRK